ncbi:MAG: hypothetical protein UT24_C0026G0004 [Candidatus Woesebacteria bacterium GW2011_GWB1_39_12]|uniref:Uncharacterized protein n=1 Tax=Candidatus Woesebacteria bacterium GW2011_GWB1_39_12 TaxID=1618574 RepID=A0A0G0M4T2_9BACT|nr:MAG: hypothetical protein UT24_C0026G0004 [Candidatus Woesebacteria bacterium GW2011_GWB1_39_12]
MLLKDNKLFELPSLLAGSFSGLDRLEISYNILILKEVLQREDTGDIELVCQAKNGPEEKRGGIRFSVDDRSKKDILYHWFKRLLGKDIETIYNSDFTFGGKICPACGDEMFKSMEPKVANLAGINSKFPNQTEYWRCRNNKCEYREK